MKKMYASVPVLVCCLCIRFFATAQVTLKIISLPQGSTFRDSIFFAGSINKWNPGDTQYLFKPGPDSLPSLALPEGKSDIQFKITRGSWNRAETDSAGNDTGNRSIRFTGSPQTISISIGGWKNGSKPVSTAAANVKILSDSFPMPQLSRKRRIWLYLPPDYHTGQKKYPVLYMHDGQNLFDNSTAYAGEWGVDETLNRMQSEGDYGAIVVGIDNGGEKRLDEYSPWKNKQYGGGEGDAYINFIVQTLKPHIDSNYRTQQHPASTALMGSSMGALISTYGAVKYPEVFGLAGAFSPAYWFSFTDFMQYLQTTPGTTGSLKIYHLMGEKESAGMVALTQQLNQQLLKMGVKPEDSKMKIDADGTHSESYWRREFEAAYRWLFPKEAGKN